jgi:hypothetical protein
VTRPAEGLRLPGTDSRSPLLEGQKPHKGMPASKEVGALPASDTLKCGPAPVPAGQSPTGVSGPGASTRAETRETVFSGAWVNTLERQSSGGDRLLRGDSFSWTVRFRCPGKALEAALCSGRLRPGPDARRSKGRRETPGRQSPDDESRDRAAGESP